MNDLREMAALTALNNMMDKGYMDICCVDSVGALMGIKPSAHESYTLLRPLHCVQFDKMPAALREAIPSLVQDCLGVSPTYRFKSARPQVIEVSEPAPRKGILRRLGITS